MRISLGRVAAALAPAIFCVPGLARAENYYPVGTTSPPYVNSYYSQAPTQSSYFTGAQEQPASPSDAAQAPTASWGGCGGCCDACCDDCCIGTWRDNTILGIGGEAFKSFGDVVAPNSAGFVGSFNTGFALGSLENIRGQIGGSYGIYDLKGRDTVSVSSSEQQTFLTMGIYKRSDVCCDDRVAWGLVYDQMWDHQWGFLASEVYAGQVRGLIGYATSEWNEFGVWGAFRTNGDQSVALFNTVRAMNQYNVYWRHNFDFGGQTMLWIGGNDPADLGDWLFGALGTAPLSDYVALYGNFTFSFPSSSTGVIGSVQQEWAFGAGLVYYLGGKAVSPTVSGRKGLPLLPVANNGTFLLTN